MEKTNRPIFPWIILLMMISSTHQKTLDLSPFEKPNIHLCNTTTPPKRTPVPMMPNCADLIKPSRGESRPIAIIVYKQRENLMTVPLFYCSKEQFSITCQENLFGAIYIEKHRTILPVSRHECLFLITSHLTNSSMTTLGEEPSPKCSWMSTQTVVSYVTKLIKSSGSYNMQHDTIIHGMAIGQFCKASEGQCHGNHGDLFWDMTLTTPRCEMVPLMNGVGTISWEPQGHRIIIISNSLNMMFTLNGPEEYKSPFCDRNNTYVYLSNEGTFIGILSKNGSSKMDNVVNLSASHHYNNFINISDPQTIPISLSLDIPAVNKALHDLQSINQAVIRNLERQICQLHLFSWESAWGLRHLSPSSSVRLFLKKQHVIGQISGSSIYYHECLRTKSWTLELKGQCGDTWKLEHPSNYCLAGEHMLARPCTCPCKSKGSSFIISLNKTHSLDLAVQPLSAFRKNIFYSKIQTDTHDISIKNSALYSPTELRQSSHIIEILDGVSKRVEMMENLIISEPSTSPLSSGMIGSPEMFASLGFVAGRVSRTGSWAWSMVWGSSSLVWILVVGYIIRLLVFKKKEKQAIRPPTQTTSTAHSELHHF